MAAPSRAAVDDGEFTLVVSPGIGSYAAGRILGRFAYLFGAEGEQALRAAAERQEAQTPDALAAELVYAPTATGWGTWPSARPRAATRSPSTPPRASNARA